MKWRNTPICERCWIEYNGTWDGDTLTFREPVRLLGFNVEQCGWCGHPTFLGVFVRADADALPFPPSEDDD